ncbi:hypothetical protein [Paraburkholderia sp. RL17-373-BIF-A]|uniref:hypothetical protein n=1 Tax=Paraburkholderia sp. RL17-373-BIF-A TaxID=3031629 RepID=UPI0038BA9861
MAVTFSTISRSFLNGASVSNAGNCSGIVAKAAAYGNPNDFREILFSILTCGIYALVKSSQMDSKARDVERAIKDLHREISENANCQYVKVMVDGKPLEITQLHHGCEPFLVINFDSKTVGRLDNTDFSSFKRCLEREIEKANKPVYVSFD